MRTTMKVGVFVVCSKAFAQRVVAVLVATTPPLPSLPPAVQVREPPTTTPQDYLRITSYLAATDDYFWDKLRCVRRSCIT